MRVNSMDLVVPTCEAGYVDITHGKAYYWSCAFYCDGGKHFATTGCICACLPPALAKSFLESTTTTTAAAATSQANTVSSPPAEDGTGTTVSPTSSTTTWPTPVTGFPVGGAGGESQIPGVDDGYTPSSPETPQAPGKGTEEDADGEDEWSRNVDIETIVLVAGAAIGGLCVLALVAMCFSGLGRRKEKDKTAPAITLYKPRDAAPELVFDANVPGKPSSRASSKSSVGSQRALLPSELGSSRASSRGSAGSLREAGSAKEDPSTQSTTVDYSGVGSVNSSWAWGQGQDATASNHLTPQRPRAGCSSSRSSSKQSRVQPSDRRSSDASGLSIRDLEVPSWRRPTK